MRIFGSSFKNTQKSVENISQDQRVKNIGLE